MRYKNSHIRKIIYNLTVLVGICQILVSCGQLIWVVYFPCTDAETNRSGNSHFCAIWRHNQQDPVRVALEAWHSTPEVSAMVSRTHVNIGALRFHPAPADSNHEGSL